jgi:probable DNA metabolism protein
MTIYLYDGSFDGLLCAIYESYYHKDKPQDIKKVIGFGGSLFAKTYTVETQKEKAQKVARSIQEKISRETYENIYDAFLSEEVDAELDILRYVQLGFTLGKKLDEDLAHPLVLPIHQKSQRVARERHRMLGLLRFEKLKTGIYYAPFSPTYDILSTLGSHFAERFGDQSFIIHDIKRRVALLYKPKRWIMTPVDGELKLELDEEEKAFQQLWTRYYQHIAIKNRQNLKLQRQFMPKKYWRFLTEKKG